MADKQDAGNEKRSDVAIVKADLPPRRNFERWCDRGVARGLAHAGSLILLSCPASGCSIVCTLPEGQRITALSTCGFLPKPKCSRLWFSAQKPLPPDTVCACCRPFQKSLTSAPSALRLLVVPSNSKSIHLFSGATVFL